MSGKSKLIYILTPTISLLTAASFIAAPLMANAAPTVRLSNIITDSSDRTAVKNLPVELVRSRNMGFNKRKRRYSSRYHKPNGKRYHRRSRNDYDLGPAILGIIIGGAIVNGIQQRSRTLSNSHIQYCYNRFRSYRAYDNSFQPYHGPRRQCRSPYWP